MTLEVEFLCSTQDRAIAKFNICSSNFEYRMLPDGEFIQNIWSNVEEAVDTIIFDKQFIRQIW